MPAVKCKRVYLLIVIIICEKVLCNSMIFFKVYLCCMIFVLMPAH